MATTKPGNVSTGRRAALGALFAAALILTGGAACTTDVEEDKIEMPEEVGSFLKQVLPKDYSFYALKSLWPVSAEDLRSNGIVIGSRVPDGLLPPNVIGLLYGGGFLSGTIVSLDGKTAGVEKFGGIPLKIAIGIAPEGVVNSVRKDGGKQIMLFSDDAAGKLPKNEIVKLAL
ncbi:MAG: hypothetical protein LBB76_00055 [Azoarcus sp.]|jgi:hypothetical protein|nr:hypothetical protein [Azoarcus sp.]